MKLNIIGGTKGSSGNASHRRNLIKALKNEGAIISKEGIPIAITSPTEWIDILNTKPETFAGFLIWEGDNIPKGWAGIINDERVTWIFTPSNHSRIGGINGGCNPDKIIVIPHGVDFDIFKPNPIEHNAFVFASAKGWARGIEDRGGVQYLLKAFVDEFSKDENVKLLLTVNPAYNKEDWDFYNEVNKLGLDLKDAAEIELVNTTILKDFYNRGDVFVLSTRAEAFGLTAAEAMACGLPVITTNFGGQTDFVTKENGWLINYKLVPSEQPTYEGVNWATPNIKHLRKVMRYCFENPREVKKRGRIAKWDISPYTWQNEAKEILKNIVL